jgi:hypothetical protein
MAPSVALISSAVISAEGLLDFIVQNGGVPMGPDHGRVSQEDRHIWIYLSSDGIASMLGDAEDEEEGYADRLVALLDGEPRSMVTVQLSKSQGSGAIALEFANRFAERWPSIVQDADEELLSPADLCEVAQGQRTAHPFSH